MNRLFLIARGRNSRTLILAVALLLAVWQTASDLRAAESNNVADLVEQLPAKNPAEVQRIFGQLVAGGPASVEQLAKSLEPMEAGNDVKSRLALHGLAHYTSRPGADQERQAYSDTLCKLIAGDLSVAAKIFLIEQLGFVGQANAVPAVGKLLDNMRLCATACLALERIGSPQAVLALRQALPSAKDRCHTRILHSLGALNDADPQTITALLDAANSNDNLTRTVGLDALARTGAPAAKDVLLKTAQSALAGPSRSRQAHAIENCVIFARRLKQAGKQADGIALLKQLQETTKDDTLKKFLQLTVNDLQSRS